MQHGKPFLRHSSLILQLQGIRLPEMILKVKDDMKVGKMCTESSARLAETTVSQRL
jgi:hypothetical protein